MVVCFLTCFQLITLLGTVDAGEFHAYDVPPGIVDRVSPEYPDSLLPPGTRCVVQIQVTIDESGVVLDAKVLRSDATPHLEALALAAAQECTFSPAYQRDVPVKVRLVLPFRFVGRPGVVVDVQSRRVLLSRGDTLSATVSFAAIANSQVAISVELPHGGFIDSRGWLRGKEVPLRHAYVNATRLSWVGDLLAHDTLVVDVRTVPYSCGIDSLSAWYSLGRYQALGRIRRSLRLCVSDKESCVCAGQ